jgi:tetratricopeptide (TPR) repeat protein
VILALTTGAMAFAAGDDLKDLQKQLAAVDRIENHDDAAIAEICRRIVEIDPHNNTAWEKRVRALLELGDYKQAQVALDGWDQPEQGVPVVYSDLMGDLANAQENYDKALRYWLGYLNSQPRATATWEKVEQLYETQKHWDKAADALTKMIAIEDSADTRVDRARCYIAMRRWDDARADLKKANSMDATDETLKALLPQFERLDKVLPKIKGIDKKVAAKPDANLILDRGLIFNSLQFYDLALEDADAALAVTPKSRRAVLQKAQALIALTKTDDAVKLRVIIKNNNFPDASLQTIGALDAQIDAKPGDAGPLAKRAFQCNDLSQYMLAQEDAEAASKIDPQSADALVERGYAAMKLGNNTPAMKYVARAAELNPKDIAAWNYLGDLEMARANYPAAIDDYSRSLKLRESPPVLQKREQCYRYSGHTKEADADLQRWQKLTPAKK